MVLLLLATLSSELGSAFRLWCSEMVLGSKGGTSIEVGEWDTIEVVVWDTMEAGL